MNRAAIEPPGLQRIAVAMVLALGAATAAPADERVYHRSSGAGQHVLVLDATDLQPSDRPQTDPRPASDGGEPRADAPPAASGQAAIPFRSAAVGSDARPSETGGAKPLVTVASSLAIVLGLFAAVTFLYRRTATASGGMLPGEAFAVLGKAPLGPRQNLTLVRVGPRILVLAIGAGSTTRLSELDDPDEVAQLTALCQSGGSRQAFQRTLQELGEEPPLGSGFVQPSGPSPRRGLFASG